MAYEYTITLKKEVINKTIVVNQDADPNAQQKPTETPSTPKTPKVENGENGSSTSSVVKAMLIAEGKRYAKYAVSNVGKYTGDSQMQTVVNNAIEGVGLGVGAITNPYATLATTTFSVIKMSVDRTFEMQQEKTRTEMSRARNGYTDLKSIVTSRRH